MEVKRDWGVREGRVKDVGRWVCEGWWWCCGGVIIRLGDIGNGAYGLDVVEKVHMSYCHCKSLIGLKRC